MELLGKIRHMHVREKLSHDHPHVALAVAMALGTSLATRMLDMSKRLAVI
jgi:hypothetical protein